MCGACCVDWDVSLEKEAHDRIRATMQSFPLPEGIAFDEAIRLREKPTNLDYAVINQKAGQCIFLSPEKRCILHQHYGPDIKGWMCKAFPFHTYQTPSGSVLYPFFSCPGMLKALAETAGDDAQLISPRACTTTIAAVPGKRCTGDSTLPWLRDIQISGAGFELVRQYLCRLLTNGPLALEERLLLGRFALEEIGQHASAGRLEVKDVRDTIQSFSGNTNPLVQNLHRAKANPSLHLRICDMIIRRRCGLKPLGMKVHGFGRIVSDFGFFDESPPVLEKRFSELYQRHYRPACAALTPLLSTYLANKVIAAPNVFEGGVIASYHTIILLYALVRLLAVGQSAARPLDQPMLSEAIFMVEKTFSHNPKLFSFWEFGADNPQTLSPLFAALALRPVP